MGPDIPTGGRRLKLSTRCALPFSSMKVHLLTHKCWLSSCSLADRGHGNRQMEGEGLGAKRSLESKRHACFSVDCAPKVLSIGLWVHLPEVRGHFS